MTVTPVNSTIFVGSSVNLTCLVVVPETVDVTVMVNIMWTGSNGQQIHTNNIMIDNERTLNYPLLFNRTQLGRYACVAMLTPLPSNSNLRQSISQQGIAQVFTGKMLYNNCSNFIDQFLHIVTLNVLESPILVSAGKQSFVLHCEAIRNSNNFSPHFSGLMTFKMIVYQVLDSRTTGKS